MLRAVSPAPLLPALDMLLLNKLAVLGSQFVLGSQPAAAAPEATTACRPCCLPSLLNSALGLPARPPACSVTAAPRSSTWAVPKQTCFMNEKSEAAPWRPALCAAVKTPLSMSAVPADSNCGSDARLAPCIFHHVDRYRWCPPPPPPPPCRYGFKKESLAERGRVLHTAHSIQM